MVQPGTVLAGKYQVERVLGQGGMGCVVSAMHLQLGQRVAIKFLLPEALRIHEAVERFLREARAAVRLKSEHVGRVIDVGQFDDGAPYMVMEFLEGSDLSGYLHSRGVVPVPEAVDFVLQACEAIAEAHQLGIVHRDLKPANLFLTRRADGMPLVKVLDFGISKASQGDQNFSLTRTTAVMGSPGYMSPEQLRSARDCDARTDVWALGIILFELTTGRQPFFGESITELAVKVAIDPTPLMNMPSHPPGFEAVVQRCLAKDAQHRYQNVAELAAAIAPFGPAGAHDAAMRIARVLQINPSSLMAAQATRFATPGTPIPGAGTPIPGYPYTGSNTGVPGVPTGMPGTPTTLSSAAGTFGPGAQPRSRAGLFAGIGAAVVAIAVAAVILVTKGNQGGSKSGDPSAAPGVQAAGQGQAGDTKPDDEAKAAEAAKAVEEAKALEEAKAAEETAKAAAETAKAAEAAARAAADAAKAAEETEELAEKDDDRRRRRQRRQRKPTGTTTTTTPSHEDEDLSNSRY